MIELVDGVCIGSQLIFMSGPVGGSAQEPAGQPSDKAGPARRPLSFAVSVGCELV